MYLPSARYQQFDGAPITGRSPAAFFSNQPPNEQQATEIRQLYIGFYNGTALSLANTASKNFTLSDGSAVKIETIFGVTKIYAQFPPPPTDKPGAWSAYPAYVDLAYTPVYDRPVIDMPSIPPKDCGDEPQFNEPQPSLPISQDSLVVRHSGRTVYSYTQDNPPAGTVVEIIETRVYVNIAGGTSYSEVASVAGTITNRIGEFGGRVTAYVNVPLLFNYGSLRYGADGQYDPALTFRDERFSPTYTMVTGPALFTVGERLSTVTGRGGTYSGELPDGSLVYFEIGGSSAPYAYPATIDTAFGVVCAGILSDAESTYDAALEVYLAWVARRKAWLETVYQAWLDCMAAPPISPGPVPGIAATRLAARESQIAALRSYLYSGVAKRHLAARLLSFPWNIATQPRSALAAAGTVTVTGPTGTTGDLFRKLNYSAQGADRKALVPFPVISDGYDKLDFPAPPPPAPNLGRDIAMPSCLFGWLATGAWEVRLQYATFHSFETKQAFDVESLSMAQRGNYKDFLAAGVVKAADGNQTICSDGYVPPGTKATFVFYDYEVWDAYCKQWIWSPHPDLTALDSIWIKTFGAWDATTKQEMGEGEFSPRAVRVQKIVSQTRQKDLSWSAPKNVALKKPWTKIIKSAPPPALAKYLPLPSVAVIVGGLAPTARAISGASTFPFYATAIHSRSDGTANLRTEWADYLSPMELATRAVIAAGKVTKKV